MPLYRNICFGLGLVEHHRVWCHALFKGRSLRTGWKGAWCGLTSKLLSRIADDCHPWHSNLCHGQMTTFILSVDRHVILKRFREQASLLFYFKSPTKFTDNISARVLFGIICHSREEPVVSFIWGGRCCGWLWCNWMKADTTVRWVEKITAQFFSFPAALNQQMWQVLMG